MPEEFAHALRSFRSVVPRSELVVDEIAAPDTLAPWSAAMSAAVSPTGHGADSPYGGGRFVLLYDPELPHAWNGAFRVICYAQAPLETDIGVDPFLADVAWSWLVDALTERCAGYHSASGTATRVLSTGYGELAEQGDGAQIELRASWTPADHSIAPHVEAWNDLVCMLAGLPPAVEGVTLLGARRGGRE
jgi:hypothetical protein